MSAPRLTAKSHLASARRFERDVVALAAGPAASWAITAAFYAAVHYVRAYVLVKHHISVKTHEEMSRVFDSHPDLLQIRKYYDLLKTYSQQQRYYNVEWTGGQARDASSRNLDRIRDWTVTQIRLADPAADPDFNP
jgi:uncharacterized protein (UPF0332 family)